MAATVKQWIPTEVAAQDLWRVSETDDVEELARILRLRPNVNARNKHGMTALMRAAHHGHERMVKALLDHGADPNLTRNDKFTALALAAFFGHTETVRILIEHGAKTEVVTRCGTSAYMWATARTFDEAARCLKSHSCKPTHKPTYKPAYKPDHEPTHITTPPAPAVVKTLKDPPEIWDLVHEVPRSFNARSAFLARITSMKSSLALRIAAVLVITAGCVVGALVLRDSQARNLPAEAPANVPLPPKVSENKTNPTASIEQPATPIEPVNSHHVLASPPTEVKRSTGRRPRFVAPQFEPTATAVNENVETKEVAAPPPVVAAPKIEPRNSVKANTPTNTLSPHMIAPAKNAPPKAKVIQWP